MLKVMRDSFHQLKWILLAVVAAFIFGFVFIDMGLGRGKIGGGDAKAYAARVNGETISYNDYYRAEKNVEEMYRQMYGQQFTPEMAQAMGLPKQVLESLIDQRLLGQEAGRVHLTATQEEVRQKLLTIPTFSQNGKFVGMELYNRYVTGPLGYASAADFEQDLAREITLAKMDSALMTSIVVSPQAADAEYRRANENAKIRYVLLPQQAAAVTVAPAEVDAWYRNHQADYTHAEQRKVRYLVADYAKIRSQMVPTEQDLRAAYDANRERYKRPAAAHVLHILVKVDPAAPPAADAAARAKAQALVQQLRGGADFAALARQNSEDPSSSGNGGDMGWVEMGQTVEPFEKAIFSVPLNAISDPIRSKEYGYHIVKVTERREESVRPFEEVRPELAAAVAGEKSQQVAKAEINRINAILKQNKPKDVQAFVNLANDKVTSNDSGWVTRSEPIGGMGSNPGLSQWVFSAKPGDVSDIVGTQRGPAIVYVAEVRPAGVSSLAEIRQKVEEDVKKSKATEAARAALAQAMAGATSIDQIAQKTGQPALEATVNRQAPIAGITGSTTKLVDTAVSAPLNSLQGPIVVGNGAIAFQVLEQKKITDAELAQNRATFVDAMRQQQARSLRAVLLQRLRKNAKIDVNDEITRPTTAPAGV